MINVSHTSFIQTVMLRMIIKLYKRFITHKSKKEDNVSISDIEMEKLAKLKKAKYGSPEYYEALKEISVFISENYKNNSYYPQHYKEGLEGMDIFDLFEMLAVWRAANIVYGDGNFMNSLDVGRERYNISPQLYKILVNTSERMFWINKNFSNKKGSEVT